MERVAATLRLHVPRLVRTNGADRMPTEVSVPPAEFSDHHLTEPQLAQFLGRTPRQLRRYFEQRVGPPRIVFNKVILYRKTAVEAWLMAHEIRPTLQNRRGRRKQYAG
jgi:hypothetical protein